MMSLIILMSHDCLRYRERERATDVLVEAIVGTVAQAVDWNRNQYTK